MSANVIDSKKNRGEKKQFLLVLFICILFVISDTFCFETPYLLSDRFENVIGVELVQQSGQLSSLQPSSISSKIQDKISIPVPNPSKRKSDYLNQYVFLSCRKHVKYCTFQI